MTAKRFRKPAGFKGWRSDIENRAAILARSLHKYAEWKDNLKDHEWDPEPELDHRPWMVIESQANQGSCVGNAATGCVEHSHVLKYGQMTELSREYAYITAQIADGISGDSGATLDGCGKAMSEYGICTEATFPYPSSYSAGKSFFNANKTKLHAEAASYKLQGEVPIASWNDALLFLKSRTGAIQLGVAWRSSLDAGWEIMKYSGGSVGGHSVCVCGYLRMPTWPDQVGLLLKNSWGTSFGKDGWCLLHKDCVEAMLAEKDNLWVGRSEQESPVPIPKPDI